MYSGIISFTASSCLILMNKEFCIPEYYNIASLALGLLLSFKYVFSESDARGEFLKNSLNMGIVPLLLAFCLIIIYNILSIF